MGQPRLGSLTLRGKLILPLLAFVFAACSNQGGCGGFGDPVDSHIDKKYIQNNAMQARLSPAGFALVESDLMQLVEAALQKPLSVKIPKTVVPGPVSVTICGPDGCDATLKVLPGSIGITRGAPDATGKSQLTVQAKVEIEAKGILNVAGAEGPTTDCQVDLRFVDHFQDVCQPTSTASVPKSWARPTNPYDTRPEAVAPWNAMKSACSTYCAGSQTGAGRGVGAVIRIGVDPSLGYPEITVDGIDLTFSSVANCPAAGDVRVFHPKRTSYTCADGTKHPECEVFEQSILYKAPLTCLLGGFLYDAGVSILSDALIVGARVAINAQLKQALSVKCTLDKDCQTGATCGTVKISDGFPAGCVGTACMMPPVSDRVCNAAGKPVPPLLGIERQINLATLTPAYTPDNAGPVKVIAAMGGFVGNDSDAQMQGLGLPANDDNRGLTIGGFFGVDTHRASCVVPKARPAIRTIEPLIIPEQVDLFDSASKKMKATDYQAAVSLHKDALAQLGYAIYTNGALCLTFGGSADFPLNSAVLAFIVTSVKDLDLGGGTRPAFLYIYPEEVPELAIGEGKLHYEGTTPVIDSPHMELTVKKLKIEFYSSVRDRFVRLFSLGIDFQLGVFLEFTTDNKLLPVTSDLKRGLSNVVVQNVEILSEKSSDLEKSIPGLLDFALPLVSQALLDGIALPQPTVLPGYEFKLLGLRGMKPVSNTSPARFEFLSGFGKLQKAGTPARDEDSIVIAPSVRVQSIDARSQDTAPLVTLALDVADPAFSDEDVEYATSLNGGPYSPFSQAREVTMQREQFRFAGPHSVRIIARKVGGLAMSAPATTSFMIENTVHDAAVEADAPATSAKSRGCNAVDGGALWWLVAAAFFFLRRRKH